MALTDLDKHVIALLEHEEFLATFKGDERQGDFFDKQMQKRDEAYWALIEKAKLIFR